MNPVVLVFIAISLAMDAFAVSVAISLSLETPTRSQIMRLASYFGFFQFLMPIAGWLAGRSLLDYIRGLDHWIAFALLGFIGGKMIWESAIIGKERECRNGDPTCGISIIMFSLATSIDALAVGLSLSLLGVEILYPSVVIGIVAFLLTVAGMKLGPVAGRLLGKRAEIAGGLILIAIGAKILIDHLSA